MVRCVRDIMTRNVITISPDALLEEAYTVFRQKKISMLVVQQADQVVGLLTERDAVRFIHDGLDISQTPVADVMSSPVIMIDEGTSLFEAYSTLTEKHFRHLVICNGDGKLAGVITLTNMLDGMGIEYFVDLKQIASIMSKSLTRVRPNDSLRLVIDLMHRHCISCVIVAERWKPVGIITERDIVKYYEQDIHLEAIEASSVMSSPVRTLLESTYIPEANKLMRDENFRHMAIVDPQGRLSGLISQTDLTSCIEAGYVSYLKKVIEQRENELGQLNLEYDAFLRGNPNAVIVFDVKGNITNANPAALQLSGYDLETLKKKSLQELLYPHNSEFAMGLFDQACAGQLAHAELQLLHASGDVIDVFKSFLPITSGNKTSQIYAVIHDITANKQSEWKLHQSEQKFRALVEISQAMPWSVNFTNGCFSYVDKRFEQSLGYPVDSWRNLATLAGRIHPEDREKVLSYSAEATKHGKDHQFKCRMIAADGKVVPVQNYVSVRMQAGQAVELNGFMFDLSKRLQSKNNGS